MNPIPYARQSINDEDVAEVVRVLRSPFLTQGPEIERFEQAVSTAAGSPFACAVSNATSALHLVCRALGIGPGDRVWTSPNSFAASANCALYCGAEIDFVDVDPATYNIDPAELERKLIAAEQSGTLPRAIVAVHFGGTPADLAEISEAARRRNIALIEDASHAVGATYRGTQVGDSAYSDATVFSFHPVKIVTTGEGGMVLTKDQSIHERVALLRTHGITRNPAQLERKDEGGWYYEQLDIGYNYRLTDIQAVLGTNQIMRLPDFLKRRNELAARYHRALDGLPGIQLPVCAPDRTSAWHLYVIGVNPKYRRSIFDRLRSRGILVNVHYIPIHLHPYYRELGFKAGDFPNAERYYSGAISLPMYAELSNDEQDRVVEEVRAALGESARRV